MIPTFESLTPNLIAKDVNKTVEYYQSVLGFQLLMSVPEEGNFDWAMLQRGEAMIMFQSQHSLEGELEGFKNMPIGGTMLFYIKMKGLQAFFDEIKDKAELVKPINKTFYGATEFAIKDLDGYYLVFAEDKND